MTATNSTVSTLLVAIDISKHRHEVLIGIPGKTRRRRLTIRNTQDDFNRRRVPPMDQCSWSPLGKVCFDRPEQRVIVQQLVQLVQNSISLQWNECEEIDRFVLFY